MPKPKPVRVYVIWGETLEPGDRPTRYEFATEAEADAFREGIEAANGWFRATEVTGPNVRVKRDSEISDQFIKNVWG